MNNCKRILEPCRNGNPSGQYTMREMSIASGPLGTLETLRIMAVLSRDAVNYEDFCSFMADVVCMRLTSLKPLEVDRYLRSIYRYTPEEVETLYSPAYNVWQYRNTGRLIGDCDDISMMYAAVFNALGYSSRFVAMRTKPNDPNFYHVVIEVVHDGRWRRFDATVPQDTVHHDYGLLEVNV